MPNFTAKRDHGRADLFWWSSNPTTGPTGTTTTWVGVRFSISAPGRITAIAFYDGWGAPNVSNNDSIVLLQDWTSNPRILHRAASYRSPIVSSGKWNIVWLHPLFRITPNTDYMALALYPGGGLYRNNSALTVPVTRNNITYKSSFQSTALDVMSASMTENTNANAIDVLFRPD